MQSYATDTDLVYYEPTLFSSITIPSQTIVASIGTLNGSQISVAGGVSFTALGVQPGHVVILSGVAGAVYPIIKVESATLVDITPLYAQLTPGDPSITPLPVGTTGTVSFSIKTFLPQIGLVSSLIQQMLEINDSAAILNPQDLRQAAALGTLQLIYSATATVNLQASDLATRAAMYERMYQRALRAAKVQIDTNGDGKVDCVRCPGLPRMTRRA